MANTPILTEAEKEAIYDAQRSGLAYVKSELDEDTSLEPAEQAIILALYPSLAAPAVLDLTTAKTRALADWQGTVKRREDGSIHRWPMLEAVEIGRLADGTAVYGDFDNDDTPHVAWVEWGGFNICVGSDGFDMGDQVNHKEYHHFTLAQWASLQAIVNSGVIDQALAYARA